METVVTKEWGPASKIHSFTAENTQFTLFIVWDLLSNLKENNANVKNFMKTFVKKERHGKPSPLRG